MQTHRLPDINISYAWLYGIGTIMKHCYVATEQMLKNAKTNIFCNNLDLYSYSSYLINVLNEARQPTYILFTI